MSKHPTLVGEDLTAKTLRRLFLTLFLRGRSSRGMKGKGAVASVSKKLGLSLGFYFLFGMFVFTLSGQSVFIISAYLHASTFIFLGMFVATSAGETLFNKEEGDILLHRPIEPRALLWAKIGVLVQVSLWLALAFNVAGFVVGSRANDGGLWFIAVHLCSVVLEALFCTATVVLMYQLCLRWFGREKLDSLMTAVQVTVSIVFVISAQLVPQLLMRMDGFTVKRVDGWWTMLLPPAWFAGIDDAIAGSGIASSWALAALGLLVTAGVLWVAFQKLAQSYQSGLQTMAEAVPRRTSTRSTRYRLVSLVRMPPLSWILRDPVARSSFLLSAAYLLRDRDTKMRVYPGIAPMMIMPIIMMLPRSGGRGNGSVMASGFGAAFSGAYVGLIPLTVVGFLELSQQWQASDVFRTVPLAGPARLSSGTRKAVLLLVTVPMVFVFAVLVTAMGHAAQLPLMLPGILAIPVYSMVTCLGGRGVPLSRPTEEAKAARRGFYVMGMMFVSLIVAGLSVFANKFGYLWWLIGVEIPVVAILWWVLGIRVNRAPWLSIE